MSEKWEQRLANDGSEDGLEPLETLDVSRIQDFDELLAAMSLTAFSGRRLGEAAEVLEAMVADPKCAVVMTLSGAMTVAKMNLVITEMVERGWVQAIVSTGALMTHGLVELAGMQHFKARADLDDAALFDRGYNRVYDTYELEKNLTDLGKSLDKAVFPRVVHEPFGSWELLAAIGEWLAPTGRRGLVSTCWREGVPIYIPAFTDSEMGLDVAAYLLKHQIIQQKQDLREAMTGFTTPFDPFRDLTHYASMVTQVDRIGIFTIGGGVPRNWAQQVAPFLDYFNAAVFDESENYPDEIKALFGEQPMNRFRYGVRICPEPVHWGGLSGCTYSEGVSWGKFLPPSEGGRYAEVYADATTVWPLLVKGVAQRMDKADRSAAWPPVEQDGYRPREG